ncbi:MAG: DUF1080 domain-containing protein [Bacteroidales bacterium]
MKLRVLTFILLLAAISGFAQPKLPLNGHPNIRGWASLFKEDLSDADFAPNVWTCDKGIFTADEDQIVFSKIEYENFILDLEFNVEPGANSGVVVYCTDKKDWIPHSVEIQILDDNSEKWASVPGTWQCASIFGHLAPSLKMTKKPGEWSRMTVACKGKMIYVVLNGKPVTTMDMSKWTSAKKNPDGSDIPEWLSTPFSELPTKGFVGLQGKHAGAKTYYRNMKIKGL